MKKAPALQARPPQKAKPARSLPVRILLLSLVFLIVGSASVILFLYSKYSIRVEAKLREGLQHYTAEIYARPFVLTTGRNLSAPQLSRRLERLGYVRGLSSDPRNFRFTGAGIDLVNQRGETIRVQFKDGRIEKLNIQDRPAQSVQLDAERISSLSDASGKKRKFVPFQDMPDALVKAVLAAEDRRFFDHSGVDVWRLIKAATIDLRNSEYSQGGSTLTQQYVKNIFLTPEKKFKRKFEEMCISLILETRLTKRQIFELYANEIYLGQRGPYSITGFGEAASVYFHKSLRELTLSESAFLAGILPAPNRFNPYRNADKALKQRNRVLDAMEENGFITLNEKLASKRESLQFKPEITYDYLEAPYFVNYIESRLAGRFTREELYKKGYRIYTSLHPDLQQAAHEAIQEIGTAVDKLVARKKSSGKPQMALIAIDPRSGEILAMIGGRNFGKSQYNRAIDAHRQPGSSFKPFVYAAALETPFTDSTVKITPAKTYVDEPVTFTFGNQAYTPRSLSGKYLGLVNLREALMLSLNIPTVELAQEIGYEQVVRLARKCGFDENIKPYPSIALGAFEVTPLEIAQAYCIFPKLGRFQRAHGIYRIESSTGTYKEDAPPGVQVIHPETAYMVTSLMQSVLDRGTGAKARQLGFDLPAAGKTGSSNDGWFVGFTPDLLCATWVGFDDNRDTTNLLGANSALPIWTAFMKRAKDVLPLSGAGFSRPQNIVTVDIDPATGLLATPACGKVSAENFAGGTEPTATCQADHASITLTSDTKSAESDKDKKAGILKKLLGVFN